MQITPAEEGQRPTYRNFSTPHRIMAPQSLSTRPQSRGLESVSENDELRSHKPIKATRFVQFRVTSDDLNGRVQDAEVKQEDQSAADKITPIAGEEIYKQHDPTALSHLSAARAALAMPSYRQQAWPKRYQEKKAGSYSFGEVPTLTRTPWEAHRSEATVRRARAFSGSSSISLSRILEQLPSEVYQCILDHLEKAHSYGLLVDVARLQTDLRSLCRVNKQWNRISREFMYHDLWLPGNRLPKKKRFSFQTPKSRLQMLKDTLTRSPFLATLVLKVRIPLELAEELGTQLVTKPGAHTSTVQLLADIVQQCPNLQHMYGHIPIDGPMNTILAKVLSTRPYLKSHAWILDPSQAPLPDHGTFISMHDKWTHMDTIAISARKGADLGAGTLSAVLQRLPALKHLMLSGIHPADFNDATLLTLPRLKSLRLQHLTGLTDQGVEQLAFAGLAPSLESLTLIGLELLSLHTVQILLSHMTRLRRFTFIQESSPEPLIGVDNSGKALMLGSPSLQRLHWNCMLLGAATASFADAIADGCFPSLRSAIVPCDFDGLVQAVCRPIPQVNLTPEDLEFLEKNQHRSPGQYMRVAWLQAQQRSQQHRMQPAVNVVVQDEENTVHRNHVIGSYLGDMQSKIEYLSGASTGESPLMGLEVVVSPQVRRLMNGTVERKLDMGLLF